ncbi:hypothetical protein G9A89_013812 [Geosiphon pyriformis]|nr:hypothetical protein G9A89_013812 [Geosiphon pyriformis]
MNNSFNESQLVKFDPSNNQKKDFEQKIVETYEADRNLNPKINEITLKAQKIDQSFDCVRFNLEKIFLQPGVKKLDHSTDWPTLQQNWRNLLRDSKDQAGILSAFLTRFSDVILPTIQADGFSIQRKLKFLRDTIPTIKTKNFETSKIQSEFELLGDKADLFLTQYEVNYGLEDKTTLSKEIDQVQNELIKVKANMNKCLMKWSASVGQLGFAFVNIMAQIFVGSCESTMRVRKSITKVAEVFDEVSETINDDLEKYNDGWKKTKMLCQKREELKRKLGIIELTRYEIMSIGEDTKELADTMRSFRDIWSYFGTNFCKIANAMEDALRSGRSVIEEIGDEIEVEFARQILDKDFTMIKGLLKDQAYDLNLYAANVAQAENEDDDWVVV